MKLICSPDMFSRVATRDESDNLSAEDLSDNKAVYSAASGTGYIEINPALRQITYNRIATNSSATAKAGAPLAGWPITCMHNVSYDREHVGYLPPVEIMGKPNALIQVIDENNGKLIYSLRSSGTAFLPRVFQVGHYSMNIGEPESITQHAFPNLTPRPQGDTPAIRITL